MSYINVSDFFTIAEVFSFFFWLVVIIIATHIIVKKNIEEHSYYQYFKWGIGLKIFGALAFNFIYIFYYGDGDTFFYYWGTETIFNMFFKDVFAGIRLVYGEHSSELLSLFDGSTGWPTYYKDQNTWAVCRFMLPFYLLGFRTFWGTTMVMNFILFSVIWRFYKMLNKMYPEFEKRFAVALFFLPSVIIWSSGILKDIWCLYAVLALFYNLWKLYFLKESPLKHISIFLFWSYILISIRPFMMYASMASIFVWITMHHFGKWENKVLKAVIFPVIIIFLIGGISLTVLRLSTIAVGKYSTVESMLTQAQIIQDDLSREVYGNNSFDIGDFEPTIPGILEKAPQALIAGMFRPYIWDGNGIFTKISGLENLLVLFYFFYVLFKSKFWKLVPVLNQNPFIMAVFCFMIIFAFMVGLTTANFGALVRYKIPVMPFLFIILTLLHTEVTKIKRIVYSPFMLQK